MTALKDRVSDWTPKTIVRLVQAGGPGSGWFAEGGHVGSKDPSSREWSPAKLAEEKAANDMKFFNQHLQEPRLAADEEALRRSYISDGRLPDDKYTPAYVRMNQYARLYENYQHNPMGDVPKQAVARMDKILEKNRLVKDVVVYRGIERDLKLGVGDSFLDKGFVSTTFNVDHAIKMANKNGATQPAVFKILASAGSHAVTGSQEEQEIIFARHSTFDVVAKEKIGDMPAYTLRIAQ